MVKKNKVEFDPSTIQTDMVPGECYLIMCPTTHYFMGQFVKADIFCIYLIKASWIPEIGRHANVMASGKPDQQTEIEPHPDNVVSRIPRTGACIFDWPYPLWREQK